MNFISVKKFLFAAIFILTSLAFSQQVEDTGTQVYVDDFTGDTRCYQIVTRENTLGISFVNENQNSLGSIWIISVMFRNGDVPFNMFGPIRNESVLIKLGESTIEEFRIVDIETDFTISGTMQTVLMLVDNRSIEYLLRYEGEVAVRLNGDNFNHDFIFTEATRARFSSQFLLECVPAGQGI